MQAKIQSGRYKRHEIPLDLDYPVLVSGGDADQGDYCLPIGSDPGLPALPVGRISIAVKG